MTERTTVHPGELIPAFEIKAGEAIERELITPDGRPCDSTGKPLDEYPEPKKGKAKKRKVKR